VIHEQDPSNQSKRNRSLLLGGAGVAILACICLLVAAGVVLLADPFGLNLLDFLRGDRDRAADAMPPDTSFYISIDLVRFGEQDARRISQVFIDQARETDIADEDEVRSDIDSELEEALGVNLSDDILPWLGRSIGLGISDLTVNDFGEPENLEWVFALTTRNEEESDLFLQDLEVGLSRETGLEAQTDEHEGTKILEWSSGNNPLEEVAIARVDDLVLLGSGSDSLIAALQASRGDSLADTDPFRDLLAELPGERALSVYIDAAEFGSLFSGLGDEVGLPLDLTDQLSLPTSQAGAALSFVEQGIRFDVATLREPGSVSDREAAQIEAASAGLMVDEKLPDDTILYVAGRALNILWETLRDQIIEATGEQEFADLMAEFESEFGVNFDSDLLQLLDEDWALTILPAGGGVIANEFDIPWTFGLLAGTTQPDLLRGTVSEFSSSLESQGMEIQSHEVNDGLDFRLVVDPAIDSSIAFGIRQEYLFVVTDEEAVDKFFGDRISLVDDSRYRDVRSAFPNNMTPAFYLDLKAMLASIEGSSVTGELDGAGEAFDLLRPISVLAAAGHKDLDRQHSTLLIFVETE